MALVKDSRSEIHVTVPLPVAREGSHQGLNGIVDESWRCERAERPSEGTPKGGTHVLAVCATSGQLDHFVALVLQQGSGQPALRERKGRG